MSSFEIMTAPVFDVKKLVVRTGVVSQDFVISVNDAPCTVEHRIDFANPTWLTLLLRARNTGEVVGTGGGDSARGKFDLAEPGEYRLTVTINSHSDDLDDMCAPMGPGNFRGFIHLWEAGEEEGSRRTLEVKIRTIRPMEDLRGYFALDLGTTNSTAVFFDADQEGRIDATFSPVQIDFASLDNEPVAGQKMNTIPTDLFIKDPESLLNHPAASVMGEAAQRMADDPNLNLYDSCFVRGAKSLIATNAQRMVYYNTPTRRGAYKEFSSAQIIEAIIRKLLGHCQREMKKRPTSVIMTYPPQWSFVERRSLERIFEQLQPALKEKRGRLKIEMSIDEASAAGLYYCYEQCRSPGFFDRISAFRIDPPGYLLDRMRKTPDVKYDCYRLKTMAYDFGGGSLDLSLIQYDITRVTDETARRGASRTKVRVKLLDADSLLHHGGNYITLRLFRLLKRRIALAASDPVRVLGEVEGEDLEQYREPRMSDMDETSQSFQESDAFQSAKNSLVARWDEVEDAIERPTLSEMIDRLRNRDREFDYPLPFRDRELEQHVETILPTQWDRYDEGSNDQLEAKRNFRILWRAAEDAKKYLVNEFNRALGAEEFQAERFEEEFEKFSKVRSVIPGDSFPRLKGLIPYERSPEIRRRACFLSLADVFLCSSPLVAQGIWKAEEISKPHQKDQPQAYNWVILAGNSSRSPLVRYMFLKLAGIVDPSAIKGNVNDAKVAVAKGACTNLIIRGQIPGLEFETHSFATKIPRDLWLIWGASQRLKLFEKGPLDEIRYSEYELDRIDADTLTIVQASLTEGGADEVAGRLAYRKPATDEYPEGAIRLEREGEEETKPLGVVEALTAEYGYCPKATEIRQRKQADDLDVICPNCSVKDATYGQLLQDVLGHDFVEVIRWCEVEAPKLPPKREAVQRFYLSREMRLYMVEHSKEGKALLEWKTTDADENVREVQKQLDPFSGAH